MVSLLRKRRTVSRTSESKDDQHLRPSLSLPDLTTPLLDPESWEELPSFAFDPNKRDNSTPRAAGRRKASVGAAQFHKPFSPWQIVPRNGPEILPQDEAARESTLSSRVESQDFRTSKARWGRDTIISQASGEGFRKRRGKGKVAKRLNIVVVGGKGVGKTSFISLLFDSFDKSIHETVESTRSPKSTSPRNINLPESTPSSPTVPGPPQPNALASAAIIRSPEDPTIALASHAQVGPTTRISSRSSLVGVEGFDRLQLRLVDTPGLELGSGDAVKEKERERGVAGLMRLIEDQYGEVMREESRIVRRGTKLEDNLVHLVVYLIDVRRVMYPTDEPVKVDWSTVGVFDTDNDSLAGGEATASLPRLDQCDIEIMRRLQERVNVLPVLARTDTLTIQELHQVRHVVRADLERAFPSHGGFGIFADPEDDDGRRTPMPRALSSDGPSDPRPPTPASVQSSGPDKLPYAIFSPSRTATSRAGERFEREYNWGVASVMDPEQSDFLALRETILGTHTKVLRNSTREILYEKYRTEKLLAKQSTKDRISTDTAKRAH